jgi:hypothetical protein
MFLLDANVISEPCKAGDGKVVAWLSRVDATAFDLSAVTLMEIEAGLLRIERRDSAQGSKLRAWMGQHILPEFSDRILSVDSVVAAPLRALSCTKPTPRARCVHRGDGSRAWDDGRDRERCRFRANRRSPFESLGRLPMTDSPNSDTELPALLLP